MVKASTATRKTLKSWLKEQKTKAEKPPTPSTADASENTMQSNVDMSKEANHTGDESELADKSFALPSTSLPVEEQPVQSVEVCLMARALVGKLLKRSRSRRRL